MTTLQTLRKKTEQPKTVTDFREIHEIVRRFLAMPYRPLSGCGNNAYQLMSGCLADDFGITDEQVKKLRIRDLLIFIGYGPGLPDRMEIEENWYYHYNLDGRFTSSTDCLYLTSMLLRVEKRISVVKQFLSISLQRFFEYAQIMAAGGKNTALRFHTMPERLRDPHKAEMLFFILSYYQKNCSPEEQKPPQDIVLRDVLRLTVKYASLPWPCGFRSILSYTKLIVESHLVMKNLFMDCLRMNMMRSTRAVFFDLIDRHCEHNQKLIEKLLDMRYDHAYEYDPNPTENAYLYGRCLDGVLPKGFHPWWADD